MKFLTRILLITALMGSTMSCDMFKLEELLDNPNAVTTEKAGVDFLYNQIQLTFNSFQLGTFGFGAQMTRMLPMGGFTYNNAFTPTSFNGLWNIAYAGLFPDVDALLVAAEGRGLDIHEGSAKLMKAYTMVSLVDIFGNVPYTEAGKGTEFISPKSDDGKSIYSAALTLIDEALGQLEGTNAAAPASDIFYGGSAANWVKFGKTLKLKIYNTTRLDDPGASTSGINALIAEGDLIIDEAEDFQFQYGNQRANPNTRHPFYNNSYENNDGTYMSNWYMWLFLNDKEVLDPRLRYYFYRQVSNSVDQDVNVYSCIFSDLPEQDKKPQHYKDVDPDMPYCVASPDGWYGRDHGNGSGIPPDGPIRTVYGLYPAGGLYDDNSFKFTQNAGVDGALGQGINPIFLSSFTYFIRAEAALTLGTNDDAKEMLETAINASFDKVLGYKSFLDPSKKIGETIDGTPILLGDELFSQEDSLRTNYLAEVLADYDAADEDGKLNIIIKEYYLALWGNGIEAYNNYRRTGKPVKMQPPIEPASGDYARSAVYPTDHVTLNQNASQKSLTDQVFWDKLPAGSLK